MTIKLEYLGPSLYVNIGGVGLHKRGEEKEYPVELAEELLQSKKQKFKRATEDIQTSHLTNEKTSPPKKKVKKNGVLRSRRPRKSTVRRGTN